jgi:hypothetical protein
MLSVSIAWQSLSVTRSRLLFMFGVGIPALKVLGYCHPSVMRGLIQHPVRRSLSYS